MLSSAYLQQWGPWMTHNSGTISATWAIGCKFPVFRIFWGGDDAIPLAAMSPSTESYKWRHLILVISIQFSDYDYVVSFTTGRYLLRNLLLLPTYHWVRIHIWGCERAAVQENRWPGVHSHLHVGRRAIVWQAENFGWYGKCYFRASQLSMKRSSMMTGYVGPGWGQWESRYVWSLRAALANPNCLSNLVNGT